MEIGQRVYVQRLQFHKWYEAHIVDIRRQKRPTGRIIDVLTCCSTLPMEYIVRYKDDTTQIVTFDRIHERL